MAKSEPRQASLAGVSGANVCPVDAPVRHRAATRCRGCQVAIVQCGSETAHCKVRAGIIAVIYCMARVANGSPRWHPEARATAAPSTPSLVMFRFVMQGPMKPNKKRCRVKAGPPSFRLVSPRTPPASASSAYFGPNLFAGPCIIHHVRTTACPQSHVPRCIQAATCGLFTCDEPALVESLNTATTMHFPVHVRAGAATVQLGSHLLDHCMPDNQPHPG